MSTTTASAPYKMSTENKRVFAGLMLGMLVASVSQTIVGPALPRIVSELGGMDHYSWVATAAMLVSAVTVPIVGKFSDLYGRRGFFIGGLVITLLAFASIPLGTAVGAAILGARTRASRSGCFQAGRALNPSWQSSP